MAAERLFGGAPAVGRTLQIESITFRVIGVNQAKGDQMVGMNGWDDWAVFIPYTTAQRWLVHSETLEQIAFEPTTREGSWEAIRNTRELLGLRHDFPPDLDTALSFFNVQEILQIVRQLFLGFRIFLVAAGGVTLLVGAIGVMNVMLVVVGERTNEIGLRKAVGATDRAIFAQFLAEAAAVCGVSGVAGTLLGVGFAKLTAALSPADGPLTKVVVLDPFIISVLVIALVAVGVVAGVVPAVRAARIPPAEALRRLARRASRRRMRRGVGCGEWLAVSRFGIAVAEARLMAFEAGGEGLRPAALYFASDHPPPHPPSGPMQAERAASRRPTDSLRTCQADLHPFRSSVTFASRASCLAA